MRSRQFKGQIGHPEHGFGFIADPPGLRYNAFHLHAANMLRATALPEEASIDAFAPPIWNQGATGSCGGHGTAGAVTTTLVAKGFAPAAPVDPRLLYTLARAADRAVATTPLQDTGTTPNALVRSLGTWGAVLETETAGGRRATDPDYTLWLQEHVNDEPKLSELQAAHARLFIGFNGIWETGAALRDSVRAAIADGYAVMAAVDASTEEFQCHDRNKLMGFTGGTPNHWVYYTAFRTVAGETHLFMRNSWGTLWTPDGCAWCNEDHITRGMFFPLVANLGL
jgi:hypothetical protein